LEDLKLYRCEAGINVYKEVTMAFRDILTKEETEELQAAFAELDAKIASGEVKPVHSFLDTLYDDVYDTM
jgi:hypothetical protein